MQQSTIRSLVRRTGSLVHNRTVPAVLRSSFPRYSSTETVTSTSANSPPPPVGVNDPKLNKLVDDISALTLLQAADFVSLLKVGRFFLVCHRGGCRNTHVNQKLERS